MIYFLERLARAALTLLLIMTVAFVILRSSGDPAVLILSVDTPTETLEAFRRTYGLDQPLPVQYLAYIRAVLSGDLGVSMRDGRSAVTVVAERIPTTLALTIPALIVTLLVGIPAGVIAAVRQNTGLDRATMMVAMAGYTIPSFVLGSVLVLIFAVHLQWLPAGGALSWRHAILPTITLGLYGAALLARFSRSAMLDVLTQPFIRTALAKGVRMRTVILQHALPNAAIPIITLVGLMVGNLVVGAVIVESVFAWPGVGRLIVTAVSLRDLAVVQCVLLLVGFTMVMANLCVDIAYGLVDPRVRTASRRSKKG